MVVKMIKSFVMILLSITFVLHSGCKKDTSPLGSEIHPFGSIEGVSLGASKQEVEVVLGEFDLCGRADGFVRSWRSANFFGLGDNCMDGLSLFFIWGVEGDPNGVGPLDMFSMAAPYNGKIREGIGIGSSLESVRDAYGEPSKTNADSWGIDYIYCFNDGRHYLNISFTDSAASRIDIGNFQPMPDGRGICD